jgi:hypothetical protein
MGVLLRDSDWLTRHVLAAMLDNTAYNYDDAALGTVSVKPLANGDAQTYLSATGDIATAQHYLSQAAGIADVTNPYPAILALLQSKPGNRGPFVAYIAPGLQADTEALTGFIALGDPDITQGSGADRLTASPALGNLGDYVIGKVDGLWIKVWSRLPAGYILALAQGGPPPLAMREYAAPALQGLFEERHSPDGNLFERRFLRYAGFGGRNRTSAVAQFIGNAAYQIPSGYATPLGI